MQFANPEILYALALLPVLTLLAWFSHHARARALARLGDPGLVGRLYPEGINAWRLRRAFAGLAVFSLLVLAAARPQYGTIEQKISRAGIDVIISLDVSRSMLAQDVKPNRLAKAKESLKGLLRGLVGHRVGIIAFAGDAFLNCPMTEDLSLADLVLESLDETSIGTGGTDIGRSIRTADAAFDRGGLGSRVLVLLTDGEDNEGQGLAAAQAAAAKNKLRIYAIGIGTDLGAPIPDREKGYLAAKDGTKVTSRMDLGSLAAIARATGGEAYLAGGSPAAAVDAVAKEINKLEKSEAEASRIVIKQDRFAWFLIPAMILMLWMLLNRPARSPELIPVLAEGQDEKRV